MAEIEPITGGGTGPGDPAPIRTAPVAAPDPGATPPGAAAPRPKGLVRWGVALLTLAVTVGVVSVAAAILAAGATASAVQGWLPKDTVAYLEIRADLPGDQRAKVGDIIAKFPGFADQASLDAKIDEALDRLLDGAGVAWTTDVKPWLGGEVGLAATGALFDAAASLESQGMTNPEAAASHADGMVALVAVKDAAKAEAWVAKQIGGTQTTETYADGQLVLVEGPLGANLAYATRANVLILGPEATVKAALDTKGSSPVATSDSFAAARKTAPSAYLAYGYFDLKAVMDAALALAGDSVVAAGPCIQDALASVPEWAAGSVRAADDALVFESSTPTGDSAATAKGSESAIASRLPATTFAAVEIRDLGPAIVAGLDALKQQLACDESTAQVVDQVEQALAMVGGAEGLVGWADDAAVAVELADGTLGGGLAATVSDEAAAGRTLDQVQALLALGGSGMGVSVRQEAYGDGELLVITLPSDVELAAGEFPEIAVTVQNGVFVLGTIDFVKHVLDTDAGTSLASLDAYERAISAAGGDGVSDVFVDIGGVRRAVESMLPADAKADYETDIKPFLEPFEAFASVVEAPGATMTSRAVITFTK